MNELRKKQSGCQYRRKKKLRTKKVNDDDNNNSSTSTLEEEQVQVEYLGNQASDAISMLSVKSTEEKVEESQFESSTANVFILPKDPALWKRDDLSSSKVLSGGQFRYVSQDLFTRKLKNGEMHPRAWLIFSESKGAVFCIPCLLFGNPSQSFTSGFRDWKNSVVRVQQHENSSQHNDCLNTLNARRRINGLIDCELVKQKKGEEMAFWRNILQNNTAKSVKTLSITRWSARYDACNALFEGWKDVIYSLNCIADDKYEKPSSRCEAKGILNKLERLESAFLVVIWNTILKRFSFVSAHLQSENINVTEITYHYSSLNKYLEDIRSDFEQFNYYENLAKKLSSIENYSHDSKQKKTRKNQFDENKQNEYIIKNDRDLFRINIFNAALDRIISEIHKRSQAYQHLNDKFSFLNRLETLESADIENFTKSLVEKYPNDLEYSLHEECIHVKSYLSLKLHTLLTPIMLSIILRDSNLQDVYPNLDIALRILLCIPASNCPGERSFSTLKRIQT